MNRGLTIYFKDGTNKSYYNVINSSINYDSEIIMFQTKSSFNSEHINNELTTRQISLELITEIHFN